MLHITTTRKGEFIHVKPSTVTQIAPGHTGIDYGKPAKWKASAFCAGDDATLIANRAAERMAARLGARGLWVGTPTADGFAYRQVEDARAFFFA